MIERTKLRWALDFPRPGIAINVSEIKSLIWTGKQERITPQVISKKNATNPKAFWNILRNVLPGKDKGSYIQNLVEDGKDLNDQEAIAESLNQYFTTIASSLLDGRTIDRNNQTKKTTCPHVLNVPH